MNILYVLIKVSHGKLKVVSSKLRSYEEIIEVHEIYGRYDIIAKVVLENEGEMRKFMQNKLLITEGMIGTETLVVLKEE